MHGLANVTTYGKAIDIQYKVAVCAADAVLRTKNDTADKVTVYGVKAAVKSVASGLIWNEVE